MTGSDRYEDVVRAAYGVVQDVRDRATLAALFDREFPHVAELDLSRYASLLRDEGHVGIFAAPATGWCAANARSGWNYVSGSPHGAAVFTFRSAPEADAFAARFAARRHDLDPSALPADRRVPGCGLHVVDLGWHRVRDIDHRRDPSAEAFLAEAARRAASCVAVGLWSVGLSKHLGQREGGYYVCGEYRQLVATFTHAADADVFRSSISDDPVAGPGREGWHAVDLGMRDWRRRGDIEGAFEDESRWCSDNGVGWNWTVDCAAVGHADRNPTRILFRSATHASAFRAAAGSRAAAQPHPGGGIRAALAPVS